MVDNALGKASRIANSIISRKLQTNIDHITGMEYEDYERIALHYSEILGTTLNIPTEEIDYYHNIYALKNISGGEQTIMTLNDFITDPSKKISERDIVLNNLGMIYGGEFSQKFLPEDLKVLDNIINKDLQDPISFSIHSGYKLALIQDYLQEYNNKSLTETIMYTRSEINNIITQYKNNHPISFSNDMEKLIKLPKYEYRYSDDDLEMFKGLAEKYNDGLIQKKDVVEFLDTFSINLKRVNNKGV